MANRFWVGGTGTWDATTTTNWSTLSGGSGGASVPSTADTVIFDSLSNATSYTCTKTATTAILGITMANPLTGTLTFAGTATLYFTTGGITISSGVNYTNTGNMRAGGACTVTTNGVTLPCNFVVSATSANVITLGSALTTTLELTCTIGVLNFSSYNITANNFRSNNLGSSASINASGSGQLYITGNASTVFDNRGSPTAGITGGILIVNLTYSGSTGTRTITIFNTNASLNVTAGSDVVSTASANTNNFNDVNFTGFSGTFTTNGSTSIFGSLILSSSTTTNFVNALNFTATSSKTITTNGRTLGNITFNGVGGTWVLQDALTSNQTVTLTNGTLNLNTKNLTCSIFSSTNSNTRALNATSSTITLSGTGTVWNLATTTGMTLTSTGSTIAFSNTTTNGKTFVGGGLTYGALQLGGATGVAIYFFTGANTWTGTWSSVKTTASTITLPASTTTTVGGWTISGSSGNLITLNSLTAGTQATLTLTGGGSVNVSYLSIKDSNATPSLDWTANNSTNVSNNTGWVFPFTGIANYNFFAFFNGS